MDREFEAVKEHLPLVEINTTAAREHVPKIESGIRRIKEKTRCFSSEWLFLFIPTLLLMHTVYTAIYCLNSFMIGSDNYGLALRTIVTRIPANYERDFKAAQGDYVEAEMDRVITNTNEPRTHPCLYLGPSGNRQGSSKCLDLDTNKVVHRRALHVLPMPDDVKRKVEALGKRGARAIERGNITFRNRNGKKFS